MLTEFTIESFRGLSRVTLQEIGAINLITGDNSAGKTAILESIFFATTDLQQISGFPEAFRTSLSRKDNQWDTFWRWLFPNKATSDSIELKFIVDKTYVGKFRAVVKDNQIQVTQTLNDIACGGYSIHRGGGSGGSSHGNAMWPRVSIFNFANRNFEADAEKFSSLASTKDGEEEILSLVKIIDSRATKLRYLKVTQTPLVYVDIGLPNLIPVSQMGQGFCILFSLFLEMLTSRANILLVDEIENGLHRDVLDKIWSGIARTLGSKGSQLFATTHSKECITAAHTASEQNPDAQFIHHILNFKDNKVSCKSQEGII